MTTILSLLIYSFNIFQIKIITFATCIFHFFSFCLLMYHFLIEDAKTFLRVYCQFLLVTLSVSALHILKLCHQVLMNLSVSYPFDGFFLFFKRLNYSHFSPSNSVCSHMNNTIINFMALLLFLIIDKDKIYLVINICMVYLFLFSFKLSGQIYCK